MPVRRRGSCQKRRIALLMPRTMCRSRRSAFRSYEQRMPAAIAARRT
jgi:hypothetical protein